MLLHHAVGCFVVCVMLTHTNIPPPPPAHMAGIHIWCRRCGLKGHSASACMVPDRFIDQRPRCSLCHTKGHRRESCPAVLQDPEEIEAATQTIDPPILRFGDVYNRYCALCHSPLHSTPECPGRQIRRAETIDAEVQTHSMVYSWILCCVCR